MLTEPTVNTKEQVVTCPGGNEWVVPRRYLVSVERALEVILTPQPAAWPGPLGSLPLTRSPIPPLRQPRRQGYKDRPLAVPLGSRPVNRAMGMLSGLPMFELSSARLQELLQRYQAEPYEPSPQSSYEKWALSFFRDTRRVLNPYIDITLQLDVSEARSFYERGHADAPGASFTAFLYWKLLSTLSHHPAFDLRCVEDRWYQLRNPPLFFPVAVGGPQRFAEVLIENVRGMEWREFVEQYRTAVDRARGGHSLKVSAEHFVVSTLIGNLPGLRFSGLSFSTPDPAHGVHGFYFGQRYTEGERVLVPFAAMLHHANADPYVLEQLVRDFLARSSGTAPETQGAV